MNKYFLFQEATNEQYSKDKTMGLKRQEAIPIRRDKRLPGKRDFV